MLPYGIPATLFSAVDSFLDETWGFMFDQRVAAKYVDRELRDMNDSIDALYRRLPADMRQEVYYRKRTDCEQCFIGRCCCDCCCDCDKTSESTEETEPEIEPATTGNDAAPAE